MGLLRLVQLDLEEVERQWGDVPTPGTYFTMDGFEYECVMIAPGSVHAVRVA